MTVKKSKKKDGRLELRPYYNAAVNHNILENKKVSEIIHTCLDEFYHDNETKVAQLNTLGNDACILIGVDQIVSADYYYYYFVSFNLPCRRCQEGEKFRRSDSWWQRFDD